MTYQSGDTMYRHHESAGDLSRRDAVDLAAFGTGVLAAATAAAIAGWRLLTLLLGRG